MFGIPSNKYPYFWISEGKKKITHTTENLLHKSFQKKFQTFENFPKHGNDPK